MSLASLSITIGCATTGSATTGRAVVMLPRPLVDLPPRGRPWPRPRLLPRPLDVAAVVAAASFASFSAVSKQYCRICSHN